MCNCGADCENFCPHRVDIWDCKQGCAGKTLDDVWRVARPDLYVVRPAVVPVKERKPMVSEWFKRTARGDLLMCASTVPAIGVVAWVLGDIPLKEALVTASVSAAISAAFFISVRFYIDLTYRG